MGNVQEDHDILAHCICRHRANGEHRVFHVEVDAALLIHYSEKVDNEQSMSFSPFAKGTLT